MPDPAVFAAPPAECRPAPFWFWNAEMSAERVTTQIAAMAAGGCGGFFIHARQGLTLPYLSAEWFARVRLAAETARAHGMQAWLYDEYPYPSGIAGGLVTAGRPELRARSLERRHVEGIGALALRLPLGRVVSALAVPLDGDTPRWADAIDVRAHVGVVLADADFWRWKLSGCPYNEKRFMADGGVLDLRWSAPDARHWRLLTAVEVERRGFKYFDVFVDPVAPGAAEAFLACTHERYAAALGDLFGETIPGIFTDEIEAPEWSPHTAAVLERAGLDLALLLPALEDDSHPRAAEVRVRWKAAGLALFAERWEAPVAAWCARHRLTWVAEKPAWRPASMRASVQRGIDAGHVRADRPATPLPAMLRANPRAAMASAEQAGDPRVRCECFHSLGWGARLLDQMWGFAWLGVQGANRFTPHAFYATTAGLAKHDAPPSFFLGTPAWPHWRLLADAAARLSYVLSVGSEVAPIALLHPTAARWAGVIAADTAFAAAMDTLARDHRGFHPVDAGDVAAAAPAPGGFAIGRCAYQLLIVPPLAVVDAEADAAIRHASASGAQVLLLDHGPATALDGVDPRAWLALPGVRTARAKNLAAAIAEFPRAVTLTATDRAPLDQVWLAHRQDGLRTVVILSNTSAAPRRVEVAGAGLSGWNQWSCDDGSRHGLAEGVIDLAPFAVAVLVAGDPPLPAIAARPPLTLPLAGEWECHADGPNALRLDRWEAAVGDGAPTSLPALPLRHRDANAGQLRELLPRPAGDDRPIWYRCDLSIEHLPDDLALLIEDGAIAARRWELTIDGAVVPLDGLRPVALLGGDRRALPIARWCRRGVVKLALRLDGVPARGGLVTPLHLVGSFALGADRRTLVTPIARAGFEDRLAAGLPYHPGTVVWQRPIDLGAATAVALPDGFRDVATLSVDGIDLGTRAWPPYRWSVPAGSGPRQITITVTGTLLPFFEGERWDDASGSAVPIDR